MLKQSITLHGRLTADPKVVQRGEKTVVVFDLACRTMASTGLDKQGQKSYVSFYTVQVWNDRVQDIAARLKKGSLAQVNGEPQINRYSANGKTFTRVRVNASSVIPLPAAKAAEEAETEAPAEA